MPAWVRRDNRRYALTAGDLCDLTAKLAPRPVRLEALVDGVNRAVSQVELIRTYRPARKAYRESGVAERLRIHSRAGSASDVATWLAGHLK